MTQPDNSQKTRNDNWATPVDKMSVGDISADAINLNVEGRRPTSPLQGFGQMWQKTYRIRLEGVQVPAIDVIAEWKGNFPSFWPEGANFYGPLQGVKPGEVAVLNLAVPGSMQPSTGIRVINIDDESFSFMTPQGHMFAGMITFSAFDDDGVTVIQIQLLIRASDPIFEMTFRLGFGHKTEDAFWFDTLCNLTGHFGVTSQQPTLETICVDKKVQWSEAGNMWHNAGIRSAAYMPVHLLKRLYSK